MKRSQEPSSFLQQQGQSQVKLQKQQNQFKALFLKNLILQGKQKGTNICQIITPIICLVFTYLITTVAEDGLKTNINFDQNSYPYKFNDFKDYDQLNTYSFKVNETVQNRTARDDFLQYYLYECTDKCDREFMGINDGEGGVDSRKGMLGNISQNRQNVPYYPDAYTNQTNVENRTVPFFIEKPINSELFSRLSTVGTKSFDTLKKKFGIHYIPDGSIKFTQLNNNSMKAQIKVDDCRDLQYHRINGISKNKQVKYFNEHQSLFIDTQFTQAYGLLHIIHMTTASYVKTLMGATVQAGFMLMPAVDQNSFVDTLINSISGLIYPLGLSLLFPVFLYSIVLQKQERLIQMMKMNGLKIRYYWLTFFIFNLLLCIITNLIFYLLGTLVLGSSFFTKTSKTLLFIVSLGWSLAQIGMATFFQTFLNKSRSANIIGYLFSIWTTMIGATLNLGSYQFPSQFPIGLQMIPPFAFVRIYYLMMIKCSNGDCFYDMGLLTTQLKNCIVFLYLGFLVFFLLGIYLFEVIPQQFGVRKSPLFPFYSLMRLFRKKRLIQINTSEDLRLRDYVSDHEQDSFSKKQRQKVISFSSEQDQQSIKNQYPLIINNMRKLYKKQGVDGFYPAVRSFNLAIARKQTFGLLGPNGAGKTTLISMITGMYQPNNGNAWIGGYDIQTNIQKAQLEMGVCPQFDLIWPQLSVAQHLYFYARLKGIPQKNIKTQVQSSIKQVKLEKFSNFAAKQLSGGMKRRLSVAISLVGDPSIIFLDQPSTGLDPENRRQLWAVLAQCQTKRALFITTHMMQQADTLCNRVGIITNGVLRTIQTPIKLKKTYGEGYDIIINTFKQERQLISQQSLHLGIEQQNWHNQQAKIRNSIGSFVEHEVVKTQHLNAVNKKIVDFMKKEFPGTYLSKHFNGYLIFKVPSSYKISNLFQTMNLVQKQLGFTDVAITNSSLQDVFMKVVQTFDTQEKKFYPYNTDQIPEKDKEPLQEQNENGQINKGSEKQSSKFKSIDPEQKASRNDSNYESFVSKNRQSILSDKSSPLKRSQNQNLSDKQKRQLKQLQNPSVKESKNSSDEYF